MLERGHIAAWGCCKYLFLALTIIPFIIQCRQFRWPEEVSASQTGSSSSGAQTFAVASTAPAGGATGVANNSTITLNLTLAANPATLSYQATAGACTGSLQVSADSFATCIGFSAHAWNGTQNSVALTLAVAMANSATYQIRVTTALQGAGAEILAATYTSTGFTTTGPPPLTITSVTPADATTNVPFATTVTVNFSATMNTGTVTMNGTLGACSGSLQVSSDNFTTCIGLTSAAWNGPFNQLTVTPSVSLGPGLQYKIRITTAAGGTGGEVLAANYTTATGFSTTITAPAAFQAFNSASKNMFVWQAVGGAANYNIYYSTSPGVTTGSGTMISGVNAPYTHTGLTNGVTYYYIVTGVNGAVIGQASSEVSATPQAFKTIFVTSTSFGGNLGGITGADANCAARAAAVPLTGQFRAYLSDSTHDAVCRVMGLTGKLASNCGLPVPPDLTAIGPYQNRNGQVVNVNLDSLIYGKAPTTATCSGGGPSLLNPIGFDEFATPSSAQPFTGTECGVQLGANCTDWTSSLLANAQLGVANSNTSTWSSNGAILACLAGAPLYCVEK